MLVLDKAPVYKSEGCQVALTWEIQSKPTNGLVLPCKTRVLVVLTKKRNSLLPLSENVVLHGSLLETE